MLARGVVRSIVSLIEMLAHFGRVREYCALFKAARQHAV